jgi:lipopolysaccharide assembly protein B
MDFDLTWLLWGLPLAFALGWGASRLDLRQWRMESRQAPKAYFRGLNHLLNEQQDQAIDAFIEAVQGDPDTAELHFALGNLFAAGATTTAPCACTNICWPAPTLAAKTATAPSMRWHWTFLKAGLLDRAETALHKLEGSAFEGEALLALLAIYERSRDWPQAKRIAQRLETASKAASPAAGALPVRRGRAGTRSGDTESACCWNEAVVGTAAGARLDGAVGLKSQPVTLQGHSTRWFNSAKHAPQGHAPGRTSLADLARRPAASSEAALLRPAMTAHLRSM